MNLKQTRPVIYGSCGELATAAAAVSVFSGPWRETTRPIMSAHFFWFEHPVFFFSSNNTALGGNLRVGHESRSTRTSSAAAHSAVASIHLELSRSIEQDVENILLQL